MLTISRALGASQAESYHRSEFTSPEQSYYTKGNVRGEWQGMLREARGEGHGGLPGQVEQVGDAGPAHPDIRQRCLVGRRLCRHGRAEQQIDVLEEIDGPMLKHGLQGFHGLPLLVPSKAAQQPDRRFLEERYATFRAGS